jgi:hypothetical protein
LPDVPCKRKVGQVKRYLTPWFALLAGCGIAIAALLACGWQFDIDSAGVQLLKITPGIYRSYGFDFATTELGTDGITREVRHWPKWRRTVLRRDCIELV